MRYGFQVHIFLMPRKHTSTMSQQIITCCKFNRMEISFIVLGERKFLYICYSYPKKDLFEPKNIWCHQLEVCSWTLVIAISAIRKDLGNHGAERGLWYRKRNWAFEKLLQRNMPKKRHWKPVFLSFPEIMIISMLRFVLKISNSLNNIPQITQFVFRTYKEDSGKSLSDSTFNLLTNRWWLFSFFFSTDRLTVTMACKLNLQMFPHDVQTCTVMLESCKSNISWWLSCASFIRTLESLHNGSFILASTGVADDGRS